jgi:hypothetical protein
MSFRHCMGESQPHHDFKMNVFDLILQRNTEVLPLGLKYRLVVLQDLLWVAAVKNQLDYRLGVFALMPPRQLDQGVVHTSFM